MMFVSQKDIEKESAKRMANESHWMKRENWVTILSRRSESTRISTPPLISILLLRIYYTAFPYTGLKVGGVKDLSAPSLLSLSHFDTSFLNTELNRVSTKLSRTT